MSNEGQLIKIKLIEFQREILDLHGRCQIQKASSEKVLKEIFLEQIEWIDHLDLIIEDIKHSSFEEGTIVTKSILHLKKRMERFFKQHSIAKMSPATIDSEPEGIKVIETRSDISLNDGVILEILRPGYKWNSVILRKSEVISVKNHNSPI